MLLGKLLDLILSLVELSEDSLGVHGVGDIGKFGESRELTSNLVRFLELSLNKESSGGKFSDGSHRNFGFK